MGNTAVGGESLGYKEPTSLGKNHPPLPRAITDPGYPHNSMASGVVIIDVTIDKNGTPSNMHTIQDVPSLSDISQSAIRSWKFIPAMEAGQPIEGTLVVAISYLRPVGLSH